MELRLSPTASPKPKNALRIVLLVPKHSSNGTPKPDTHSEYWAIRKAKLHLGSETTQRWARRSRRGRARPARLGEANPRRSAAGVARGRDRRRARARGRGRRGPPPGVSSGERAPRDSPRLGRLRKAAGPCLRRCAATPRGAEVGSGPAPGAPHLAPAEAELEAAALTCSSERD